MLASLAVPFCNAMESNSYLLWLSSAMLHFEPEHSFDFSTSPSTTV